jgi:hypothetical protein
MEQALKTIIKKKKIAKLQKEQEELKNEED